MPVIVVAERGDCGETVRRTVTLWALRVPYGLEPESAQAIMECRVGQNIPPVTSRLRSKPVISPKPAPSLGFPQVFVL
jgi:hypothetical protein